MADVEPEGEIQSLLDEFVEKYEHKDLDGVLAVLSDNALVMVGTGADEVVLGLDEARSGVGRDMSQVDDISFVLEDPKINVVADAAFVYSDATLGGSAGGHSFDLRARFTCGAVRTTDGWRIVQTHLSLPDGEQAEGSSYPG